MISYIVMKLNNNYHFFTIPNLYLNFDLGQIVGSNDGVGHLIIEDQHSDDHSLMVIEDKAGSTIVSGGVSNVLSTSVLESLYEEDDDSSSTTDETTDQGGGLDSGCGSTKAENSDVSSLSGGFAGKNENILNGVSGFNQGVSSLGSNQSSSSAAMAAAMASAMAMMTPTSPRSVTTAGSMASASGRKTVSLIF